MIIESATLFAILSEFIWSTIRWLSTCVGPSIAQNSMYHDPLEYMISISELFERQHVPLIYAIDRWIESIAVAAVQTSQT